MAIKKNDWYPIQKASHKLSTLEMPALKWEARTQPYSSEISLPCLK